MPVRREGGVHRLLEQVRSIQRFLGAGDGQRGGLLQQALPVALDAVQLNERRVRSELAAERAVDGRRHAATTVARLDEETLDLVDERAELAVSGAVPGRAARERDRRDDGRNRGQDERGKDEQLRASGQRSRCCVVGRSRGRPRALEGRVVLKHSPLELL